MNTDRNGWNYSSSLCVLSRVGLKEGGDGRRAVSSEQDSGARLTGFQSLSCLNLQFSFP